MPRGPDMRLFVAVYPPPEVTGGLLALLDGLPLPPHRATPAEQLHLTLLFIGDTRAADLRSVKESIERAASGAGEGVLTPRRLVAVPVPEPRLVALEADASAGLLEVQRRLVTRLARRAGAARAFLPHITLARLRTPAARTLAPQVERDVSLPPFGVPRIDLVQSVLSREGARHETVASFPLSD